ncbi:MAG: extracellular solute-binding protein [Tissierellia bacterium]|nr:extracellular solute-binding protein [Tissierellia bacterium]
MKKLFGLTIITIMIMSIVGCSTDNGVEFNSSRTINVITREDGSGTRGAFTEIVGILEGGENGEINDRTYVEAIVQNSTDAVMTSVTGDEYSIGYISLGSLNENVKAVKIDGVEATAENVQNKSYKISRPFNIAYKGDLNPLAEDFINFILSTEGQDIVVNAGYVQVGTDLTNYERGKELEGTLVIAGSTSVTPVMEELVQAYKEIYPKVTIEIQSTGSSAGMQAAIEGTADIGMASRELKESELAELTAQAIAMDGIAVIVNNNNPVEDLSLEQIKSIYVGEITEWNEVIE